MVNTKNRNLLIPLFRYSVIPLFRIPRNTASQHFINMVKNKKGIILNSAGDVAAMSLRWIMVSKNYLKQ